MGDTGHGSWWSLASAGPGLGSLTALTPHPTPTTFRLRAGALRERRCWVLATWGGGTCPGPSKTFLAGAAALGAPSGKDPSKACTYPAPLTPACLISCPPPGLSGQSLGQARRPNWHGTRCPKSPGRQRGQPWPEPILVRGQQVRGGAGRRWGAEARRLGAGARKQSRGGSGEQAQSLPC